MYGDFRSRFGAFVKVRNALFGRRIRAHVFSGIEFQMFVFIVGPVTGWIVGTTLISAVLLVAFELLLIFKLWTATRSLHAGSRPRPDRRSRPSVLVAAQP